MKKLLSSVVVITSIGSAFAQLSPAQNVYNYNTAAGGVWKEQKYIGSILEDYSKNWKMYYVDGKSWKWDLNPFCTGPVCSYQPYLYGNKTKSTSPNLMVAPRGLVTMAAGGAPGPDFVVMGGIVDAVMYGMSPGYAAPGAVAKASCRTSPTQITESEEFWTATSNSASESRSWESSVKSSNKYTVGLQGGLDWFGFAETKWSVGYEFAVENARSQGKSVSNTWTDTFNYKSSNTVGTTITPGTIGVTAIQTPEVYLFGLFKMGRLFQNGGTYSERNAYNGNKQDVRYRIFTDGDIGPTRSSTEKTPWWHGRIVTQATYIKKGSWFGQTQDAYPTWYVSSPVMNVTQYKQYCQGDMAARTYAAAMKPQLCKAGIDVLRTCV